MSVKRFLIKEFIRELDQTEIEAMSKKEFAIVLTDGSKVVIILCREFEEEKPKLKLVRMG